MTAAGLPAGLAALAEAAGLESRYLGWRGLPVEATVEALLAALRGLGVDVRDPDDAARAQAALERARWAERVAPVAVAWDGALDLAVRAIADRDAGWTLTLTDHDGRDERWQGRLFDLVADGHVRVDGALRCVRHVAPILQRHPPGYYQLRWTLDGADGLGPAEGETTLILAPGQAWGAPGSAPRTWGVFAPLHAVRSPGRGATGDLASLRRLFGWVRAHGGHHVATLPLLAGFFDQPCEPSPYSPASRLFWNELYLDLGSDPAAPVAGDLVDYRAQYRWKRGLIDAAAARAWADPAQAAALEERAGESPLADYAVFRAIGEQLGQTWPCWPAAWRDQLPFVGSLDHVPAGVDLARVRSHVWAQLEAGEQLAALKREFDGLYLDLPVGVNRDAYEVWRQRELFLLDLSAGAPPDALFLGGQDWGLPPLHPEVSRRTGHRYVIDCVRHHMSRASMLRIDHVMGLHRLYCVPRGFAATEGVYVRYPDDELYAIVVVESHRQRCAVVGEDLGTVPDQVRPRMRRRGLAGLSVGQFGMPWHVGEPLPRPGDQQVASLNTHDTPTFRGWWQGADLVEQRALALIDDAALAAGLEARAEARRAALAAADPEGRVAEPDGDDAARAALFACTGALAASDAPGVLITVEDLWGEARPQNVPGTSHERPNWRRPWSRSLDEVLADPDWSAFLAEVDRLRRRP